MEIPALNPISPYFPGGIGNIRQFAVEQTIIPTTVGNDHGIRAFSHAKRLSRQIRGL